MKKILDADRAAELWEAVKSRSIPTKPITSADYSKLSEEEKQSDTLYVVTDDNYFFDGGSDGVLSFNSRTGDVLPQKGDYTAEDVGALPNTWTPEIADVQGLEDALNGKQPTLVGNPGQLIGISDDGAAKATIYPSNPNLLDNWYFVGGGSQQGGGQFPINQRGNTKYTGGGYTIDRWRHNSPNGTTTLLADGITFVNSETYKNGITQYVENINEFLGKTLTFSAIAKVNSGNMQLGFGYTTGPNSVASGTFTNSDYQLLKFTSTVPSEVDALYFQIISSEGGSFTIKAAKLELGDTQTLAHQENGQWVLNDTPPNYALELLKCYRYLQPICTYHETANNDDEAITSSSFSTASRQAAVTWRYITEMRAKPTLLNLLGKYLNSYGRILLLKADGSYVNTQSVNTYCITDIIIFGQTTCLATIIFKMNDTAYGTLENRVTVAEIDFLNTTGGLFLSAEP